MRDLTLHMAEEAECDVLARLHASAFVSAWSAEDIGGLIKAETSRAFVASVEGGAAGFVIASCAGGEAEILTLAVLPQWRRSGIGRLLMTEAAVWAQANGAEAMFLEVAEDNHAALSLYKSMGFVAVGRRENYYDDVTDSNGLGKAALVLKLALNT